ncbi:hypothetical protein J437_LFUL014281 [Ladona fulva]|uniref:Carboxylic ester hydrolase n=1 Tax=Ladona fulva TaxID=123851 RepID=A0A8K0P4T0_LADFU|nr:hypothetical protein J437_LFUL014281 [Ladona fulva]
MQTKMRVGAKLSVIALLGLVSLAVGDGEEATVVQTSKGRLRGTTMTSRNGREFYAFRGVRYALPPVGELRFKPPVAVSEKWNSIKNATEDGASCPQAYDFLTGSFSEDCLFLNVYTPQLPSQRSDAALPVIVWFHHGGWFMLSAQSTLAGPTYLLDEDIVLVAVNYRLGALGFLSTGDSVVPGNNGLKDQVAALEWVRDNIAHFGGDPNMVTIYGYSAGSASVQFHLVSPLSAGLFHRAVSSSGSALSRWALGSNAKATARRHAKILNCPSDDNSKTMIDCLRRKDANDIAKTYALLKEWAEEPVVVYPPVIEPEGSSDRPFLTADPLLLFQSGNFSQVPWMTGSTDNESMVAAYEILQNQTLLEDFNENFERIMPIILNFERDSPEALRKGQRIKEFYFGNKPITQDSLQALTDMYTESSFQYPVDRSVKLVSKVSSAPVYLYQFTYRGRYGHMPKLPGQDRPYGAVHHDDLIYIFYGQGEYFPFFSSEFPEFVVSQRLVKMLANFARTGNPIPAKDSLLQVTWQPLTPSNLAYMEIGAELKMKRSLRQDRVAFWDEIFSVNNSH